MTMQETAIKVPRVRRLGKLDQWLADQVNTLRVALDGGDMIEWFEWTMDAHQKAWENHRRAWGFAPGGGSNPNCSGPDFTTKSRKSWENHPISGWYGKPHTLAVPKRVGGTACANSTSSCRDGCLDTAGRGNTSSVNRARLMRSDFLYSDPLGSIALWHRDIGRFKRSAARRGLPLAHRPNGTSDHAWERIVPELFHAHPDVQFMDYTKRWWRLFEERIPNYYLTPSVADNHDVFDVIEVCEKGFSPVVVTEEGWFPERIAGIETFDATGHDLRFTDKPGTIGILQPLGKMGKQHPSETRAHLPCKGWFPFVKARGFGQELNSR
jgi:hypothetical protein